MPPKQRGMPPVSSLQTSFIPLQQFCDALTAPPSRSTGAPQMLPTPLHDWPLSQRPAAHNTEPFEFTPPPQQALALSQEVPVSRQPPAGWHTVAPEPGSTQMREQQLVPLVHGFPSWVHEPPPPPLATSQLPTPPSLTEQRRPQQSSLTAQRSPLGWQEYAFEHLLLTHRVEQQFEALVQESPSTLQLPPPGMLAQKFALQTPVQHSEPDWQAVPRARHDVALH